VERFSVTKFPISLQQLPEMPLIFLAFKRLLNSPSTVYQSSLQTRTVFFCNFSFWDVWGKRTNSNGTNLPEDRRAINTKLDPFELEIGGELNDALTEAASFCICRISALAVKLDSRQELLKSAVVIDQTLINLVIKK
jgi:hypothetical protein